MLTYLNIKSKNLIMPCHLYRFIASTGHFFAACSIVAAIAVGKCSIFCFACFALCLSSSFYPNYFLSIQLFVFIRSLIADSNLPLTVMVLKMSPIRYLWKCSIYLNALQVLGNGHALEVFFDPKKKHYYFNSLPSNHLNSAPP